MFKNMTAVPNTVFDTYLKDLSIAELKVLLIIIRQTYGWQTDKKTKSRKKSDWISVSQFVEKTGASSRSINSAIRLLIEKNLIEVTNEKDVLLDTGEKRRGQYKLFFRLSTANFASVNKGGIKSVGEVFADETTANNAKTIRKKIIELANIFRITKETPTKETLTKINY